MQSSFCAYILCTMKTEMRVLTSARRRTRSGGPRTARTGAERRHRTFEPRPTLEKKNDTDLVSFFFQARDGDRTHALIYFLNVHIQNFAHVARFPFEKKDFQRLVRGNLFSKGVATGESWGAAAGGSITPNF